MQTDPIDPPSYVPRASLSDYSYELPEERIASFPLERRDSSRLLVCDRGTERIEDRSFGDLPSIIPPGALLIANDTRVVRARLVFHKESGARIEIFLLEPLEPSRDPGRALAARGQGRWLCLVGGARKLRRGEIGLALDGGRLDARLEVRSEETWEVSFRWTPADMTFGEVLERAGQIPLPPYIKRETSQSDSLSYQTIYAASEGAVAAPTAGLHFTPELLEKMTQRDIEILHVTLHVGAGTFKPVQSDDPLEHRMHEEPFAIGLPQLERIIEHVRRRAGSPGLPIVTVGTTTLRTMESLYWAGVKLLEGELSARDESLVVEQWDPYRLASRDVDLPTALDAVNQWGKERGSVSGRTGIMIIPGYDFRTCDALLTNFHQPESTLILLVGAFLGRDLWRRVYDHALASGYRFLSYGDSSLLIRDRLSL